MSAATRLEARGVGKKRQERNRRTQIETEEKEIGGERKAEKRKRRIRFEEDQE